MSQNVPLYLTLLISVFAAALGGWIAHMRQQRRIAELSTKNTELDTTLEMERSTHIDKLAAIEKNHDQARSQLRHLNTTTKNS